MTSGVEIGALRVDLVPEVRYRLMPRAFLFPDLIHEDAARNADWIGPRHLHPETLAVGMAFQAYLIRARGQNILVDTCNGNHKPRPHAPWQDDMRAHTFLTSLADLGLRPEDIHIVLCTHLHTDHVGWNTRLVDGRWVPTFPNARYVMNKAEYDHFAALVGTEGSRYAHIEDSVLPVVDAGQAEMVSDTAEIISEIGEEVFLSPSPGHSPGHVCIHARANGAEAVISGDAIHHPIQLDMPDLVMRADGDAALAAQSRRAVMEHCAGTSALLCAGHIPDWSFARVHEGGRAFRLDPL
ncbi:MBL fold metallo-hydrolase [Pseudooceanicola sp. MF1-13]|uniref:MBL fold metallo-hydrolase n=1 Tax=Pseudooceanicola sp. MF1-13 TaxID=3379095 RepID=UPI003891C2C5